MDIADVGVTGIFIILVIREVFTFVSRNKPNGTNGMAQKIRDLHEWHAPSDAGVQEWKNPAIHDLLERLSEAMSQQTQILERMDDRIKKIEEKTV